MSIFPSGRITGLLVERRWAAAVAAFAMAVTLIPYLAGFAITHAREFMWLGYNLDDSCVYLSWMRQSADGAFRTLNLFTTDPQRGMAPNPLFWFLGRVAGVTHLPLLVVYHGARIACGFALLIAVWELINSLVVPQTARRLAFLCVCFSAGLGWMPGWLDGSLLAPVDKWQPEAITFLSLYLSPLFCFSMILQIVMIQLLLLGDRTGKMRFAACAGLCGFVLGFTHTYDIITMTAVWLAYLVAITISRHRRGLPLSELTASWSRAVIAGVITFPAVAYIAYQLMTETVFRERAVVPTLAPPFYLVWIILGYGFTLMLAIIGAVFASRRTAAGLYVPDEPTSIAPQHWTSGQEATMLLVIWSIANIACAYFPAAFQRKMLQGAHFPIAILAGIGAAWILKQLPLTNPLRKFPVFAITMTLLLCPSNIRFMARDIANFGENLGQTKLHRPYLLPGEITAMEWLKAHTLGGTAVQPLPWVGLLVDGERRNIYTREATLMCFTPGLIDRPVYCGHWGETPDFQAKLAELRLFATKRRTDEERITLLRAMRVKYLVFSQKRTADMSYQDADDADEMLPMFRGRLPIPDYLKLRYSNPDADVYEVVLP